MWVSCDIYDIAIVAIFTYVRSNNFRFLLGNKCRMLNIYEECGTPPETFNDFIEILWCQCGIQVVAKPYFGQAPGGNAECVKHGRYEIIDIQPRSRNEYDIGFALIFHVYRVVFVFFLFFPFVAILVQIVLHFLHFLSLSTERIWCTMLNDSSSVLPSIWHRTVYCMPICTQTSGIRHFDI